MILDTHVRFRGLEMKFLFSSRHVRFHIRSCYQHNMTRCLLEDLIASIIRYHCPKFIFIIISLIIIYMHAFCSEFLHHHSMWYSCELPSLILVAVHMICAFGAQEFTVVFFLLLSKAGPALSLEFQVAIQIHVPMAVIQVVKGVFKSRFALCSLVDRFCRKRHDAFSHIL